MSADEKKAGSTASLKEKFNAPGGSHAGAATDEEGWQEQEAASPEEALLELPSKEELQKQLTEAEEKANRYYERAIRMQAEMDNLQRRVERDIANAHKYSLEKFISELLPVIDNLERALAAHAGEERQEDSLLTGVEMTRSLFLAALAKFGVEQVDPMGQPFNPELHQAVSTQAAAGVAPNTIVNVLQNGYLLNKRLVRPALVVVAK